MTGRTQSCSHGRTCKPDYPKKKKNRSVEHNTVTHADAPVSTQRITVCQSRQCLVAHLQHALNTTTLIYQRNRHVLWTGTTGLGMGQKGKATGPPPSRSLTLCPPRHAASHLCQKNFCSEAQEPFLSVTYSCKDYTGRGFHSSPHNSSGEKTHTRRKKNYKKLNMCTVFKVKCFCLVFI